MACPHGTCKTCVWSTHTTSHDHDGDTWHRWVCWRCSGSPETRMETTTDKQPPGCESHLKPEKG